MTCSRCGAALGESTRFCTSCGAATPAGPSAGAPPAAPVAAVAPSLNGFAVVSLVLGLIGGSVLALVFGYVGRSQIKRANGRERGSGIAIAGIVLGWIGVVATVSVVVVLIVAANSASTVGSSAFESSNDNTDAASGAGGFTVITTTTTRPLTTTTTSRRTFGTYRITDAGVIIRTGPGTSYPEIGKIPPQVLVPAFCRVSGEGVVGPYNGPPGDPWWDQVTYNGVTGFVTDEYVDNQSDVRAGHVLPPC
ncbi:MAG TPA: DUF4190 domain-containing protein [Acidimicrobiia bacterium]|jgi:hypothetical protein